jgi:hypothetical protein
MIVVWLTRNRALDYQLVVTCACPDARRSSRGR